LERQFGNFLESVPYLTGNENTYSFRLANLILAIGAHIDSAFKEIARYPEFCTKYPEILKKRQPSIADYFPLAEEYRLPQRKVIFKRLPEREQLIPFQQYTKVGDGIVTPNWWRIYNRVKHRFSENFEKANLQNARDALAGAFLLNVIHTPAYIRLIEYNLVKSEPTGRIPFTMSPGGPERIRAWNRQGIWLGFIETPLFSCNYRE
jgi:hypothetical protein